MKRKPLLIAISLDAERNVLSAHALTSGVPLDAVSIDHKSYKILDGKWDGIEIQFVGNKRISVTIMEQR